MLVLLLFFTDLFVDWREKKLERENKHIELYTNTSCEVKIAVAQTRILGSKCIDIKFCAAQRVFPIFYRISSSFSSHIKIILL